MRFAMTIGIVLGMLGTAPGPFARQSGAIDPAVRQGIQQTWDEFTVALRQKDAAALARAWAPDGDHGGLTPDTTIRNGRADIEAMWIAGLPGLPARDRKVSQALVPPPCRLRTRCGRNRETSDGLGERIRSTFGLPENTARKGSSTTTAS